MLRAGFGCINPRFEKESSEQDRDEGRAALAEAQAAKRGMWAQSQVQCGFDYRREKKGS
jgi:endonuclease YncB( thermonuclease family)